MKEIIIKTIIKIIIKTIIKIIIKMEIIIISNKMTDLIQLLDLKNNDYFIKFICIQIVSYKFIYFQLKIYFNIYYHIHFLFKDIFYSLLFCIICQIFFYWILIPFFIFNQQFLYIILYFIYINFYYAFFTYTSFILSKSSQFSFYVHIIFY